MKLTIVTETFPPEINGVAMTFGHLARGLAGRGHEITIVRPRRTDLPPPTSPPPYTEVLVRGIPIPNYPMLRLGLPAPLLFRRRWRADRPDLIHIVTEGPLGASAINAARAIGIPLTSSFHTNFHAYTAHYGMGPLHRLALGWLRRVHNRTRRTFAPTVELCDELRGLGFLHTALLSRGVDTEQFSPARRSAELRASWGVGPDEPVVLHAGRMAAEKNYPLLFQAFAAMRAANPRCRFVLVGDGPLRAEYMRAHPDYLFPGFVPRDALATHYASADIYIHASLTETFGNVLTEAMASGLAVAGFDYAAGRQFVRHQINGLLVPTNAPEALVSAAISLVADAALRQRLRTAARAALVEQSWDKVIGRFEADLLAVIAEAAAPSTAPVQVEPQPTTL